MDSKDRRRRAQTAQRRKRRQQLVYTEPKPFNRNKFLLQLAIVLAVVLALVLTVSIFFKVGRTVNEDQQKVVAVLVSGNDRYTAAQVVEASGIREGESLVGLNRSKIRARILQELPYVSSVRVGIKLPDTVNIEITESSVFYSIEALDGNWWVMSAEGKILEQTNWLDAKDHTVCEGVRIQVPEVGQQAVALEPEPQVDAEGNTVPVTVTGAQTLEMLLQILDILERYGILGEAASVNLTDLSNIQIWYGQQFRIDMGDYEQLEKKIGYAKAAMNELESHRTGVIDVSFTVKPDQPVFTPFAE